MATVMRVCRAMALVCSLVHLVSAHGTHGGSHQMHQQPTSFSDPNVVGDKEHLKQHMQGEINMDRQMSPEEMEFHYFRLHDVNNDSMLDGLELLKAFSHMMPPMDFQPHEINGKSAVEVESMRNERTKQWLNNYVYIIDNVLESDDRDKDGYLSYPEYIIARKRDAQRMTEAQQKMLRDAAAAKDQMLMKQQEPYTGV